MVESGYLYVLANSAMPGLVKVGKTTRSPSERALELSSATGLPTPFIVVYEEQFSDCGSAERFVHTILENRGFRVSDGREFFNAPVNEIVRAIGLAKKAVDRNPRPDTVGGNEVAASLCGVNESDELEQLQTPYKINDYDEPWSAAFEEAERHFYGLDDYIQDYGEALRFYRQAATLGSLEAYAKIGRMYDYGEGMREDQQKAFEYYKEGARKGSGMCYWCMALHFTYQGNCDSAEKCMRLMAKNSRKNRFGTINFADFENEWIVLDSVICIDRNLYRGISLAPSLLTFIEERRGAVIRAAQKFAEDSLKDGSTEWARRYQRVAEYLASQCNEDR